MTSAPAIGFEYHPSRWLARIVWPVIVLSLAAIWLSGLAWVAKAILAPWVIIAAAHSLSRFAGSPVTAAGMARDGSWTLRTRGGQDVTATLVGARVLTDRGLWLLLRAPGLGQLPLLLAPDNSDADIRRRMRMRLAAAPTQEALGTLPVDRGPTV
ncbi:hypothetical protein DVT68_02055 [Dyella solisilvae]|uniref:Toxin CptA n=1 Tax=Dyella solisilvae TaxID=1920168 RepID=A0A370KAH8_9GAMM|nr:hypothetical protein [Dyella solisilvae]RDI99652.1 hypothetical protein DVT68_02055 [Dyella solisilvae]